MPSVLFVCTGNTCRSPMAEVLFRERLKQADPQWADWLIESAGTWAPDGGPAARESQAAVARRGLSLQEHRARTVTPQMMEKFNLVLVMEFGHKEALRCEFPRLAKRIYLLSEMAGKKVEVADPIGGTRADYEDAARTIEKWIDLGMTTILEKAK